MILIGGEARSGTTLLQVMLDSHPELHVGPEMHLRNGQDYGHSILDWLIAGDWGDQSSHACQFCHRALRFGWTWDELLVLLADHCNELREDDLLGDGFAERCELVGMIASHASSAGRRPGFKVMRDIALHVKLREVWPDAHFLLVVRDPRDVWCSHRQTASASWPSIERGLWLWSQTIEAVPGSWNTGQEGGQIIRYEDLIAHTREVMVGVCFFLGVEWDDAVLDHANQPHAFFDHPEGHASIHQVTRPVYTSAVGRYRDELSEEDVARFEAADGRFGGWMADMGYL